MRFFLASVFAVLLVACSGGGSDSGYGNPPPDNNDPAWAKVAAVVQADCAGCHNGTKEPMLTPSSVFKSSPVKAKLTAGAMPPAPKTISDSDKQVLLGYAVN